MFKPGVATADEVLFFGVYESHDQPRKARSSGSQLIPWRERWNEPCTGVLRGIPRLVISAGAKTVSGWLSIICTWKRIDTRAWV